MRNTISLVTTDHDTDLARAIGQRAARPERGWAIAQVTPNLRRRHELGQDLLEALGKRHDVSGCGRNADRDWELLAAWLLAHPINNVVMLDAQWLPGPLLDELCLLAVSCQLTLWLVAHQPIGDHLPEQLERWPHQQTPIRDLVTALANLPQRENDPVPEPFPEVPLDTFATFRAACRDRLASDEFHTVDQRYLQAAQQARDWFAGRNVTEEDLCGWLLEQIRPCQNSHEMLTVVRAVQAAALSAGWFVQVDLAAFLFAADATPPGVLTSPATWRQFQAYREPHRGAACALLANRCTAHQILDVTLGDIATDGRHVHVDGRNVDMPPTADLYLRAQRQMRVQQGADTTDPLFDTDDGKQEERAIPDAARQALKELGVPIIAEGIRRRKRSMASWVERLGISVQEIR